VALLLGFSLSMAVSRFDVRGQLVQAEATAIGTAHLRARLLPAPEGPVLEDRLRRYVDLSLETAACVPDRSRMAETVRAAEALQTEMLATAVTLAAGRAPGGRRRLRGGAEGRRRRPRALSAFESFVPETVLQLLGLAALGGALLAGYGCGIHGQRNRLATTVHTVLVCVVILVIVDLDRPQHGMIRVSQRSLERLKAQLATTARAAPPSADRPGESQPVRYRCDDGQDVLATFVQIDPRMARIERSNARWVLPLQRSGSGARYSDGKVTFWEHQGEARLELQGRVVTCRLRRPPPG
jgi:membrane-bound inhibitor of C-type lysozyme